MLISCYRHTHICTFTCTYVHVIVACGDVTCSAVRASCCCFSALAARCGFFQFAAGNSCLTHTHTRTRIPPSYAHTRFARSLSGTDSLSLLRAVTPALPISRYRPRSVQLIIILNRQLSFVLILCFQFASARAIYAHSLRSCFYFFFTFLLLALLLLLPCARYIYCCLFLTICCCHCRAVCAALPLPLLETFWGCASSARFRRSRNSSSSEFASRI